MLDENNILEQYIKESDINRIFELIINKKIIKTQHFYDRLIFRDLSENLVDKTLSQKDKIKLIDKRKHKKDIGYDLHYELDKNKTLKLCFIPLKEITLLINAILRDRRWQGSIRLSNRRR